jgi:antagonist of KipI
MAAGPILKIMLPGALTAVQDLGRYGHGRYGVAPSGALDSLALRIANLLVGNREDQACLEVMLLGPQMRALTDVVVAVTGGNLAPHRNGQSVAMWQSFVLSKDDILAFKSPVSGLRAYIAVRGGIGVPSVMGSKSTNLPSGFGGHQGRPLKKDDILVSESSVGDLSSAGRSFDPARLPAYANTWTLRVIWGPQEDHFSDGAREKFLKAAYKMSPESDRTGIRLQGPEIQCKPDVEASIISEGVIAGAVQIPGDGKPIIILGETVTGGYRKIATIIAADLSLLGQIKPGDEVRFTAVGLEAAHRALQDVEDLIDTLKRSLSSYNQRSAP